MVPDFSVTWEVSVVGVWLGHFVDGLGDGVARVLLLGFGLGQQLISTVRRKFGYKLSLQAIVDESLT